MDSERITETEVEQVSGEQTQNKGRSQRTRSLVAVEADDEADDEARQSYIETHGR